MEALTPTPLTVVGAGPAGIMAAWTAAEAGVHCTLIDDNRLPGGQYYRQSPSEFAAGDPAAATSGHPEAPAYYARLNHPRIRTLYGTIAWGAFEPRMLALADQARAYTLSVDRAILATGAYDRPLAFPGWTLPGVQGAGATLRMLKSQWLRPGKRVLLAGLGPLQMALADALLRAEVDVVAVAEAARPFAVSAALAGFWGHTDRLRQAAGYLRALRRHHVPYLTEHAIVAATGAEAVQGATIARLNAKGVPMPGTERHFEVDTVCLGYGLLPTFQLAAAFGCDLRFDEPLRWWAPQHDEQMQTTQPGIFIAGDASGIAGAEVAALQGQLAGLAAAQQLGCLSGGAFEKQSAPIRARLRSLNRLTDALNRAYAFPEGIAFLAQDDTLLCRCDEVTLQKVKAAIAQGGTDLHQLKLRTRAGMGYCQGRNCSAVIAPHIARATGQPLASLRPFTIRPPLQPVPLEVLASGASSIDPD